MRYLPSPAPVWVIPAPAGAPAKEQDPLRGSALVDAIVQLRAVARAYPERKAEVAALIEAIILGESAR